MHSHGAVGLCYAILTGSVLAVVEVEAPLHASGANLGIFEGSG